MSCAVTTTVDILNLQNKMVYEAWCEGPVPSRDNLSGQLLLYMLGAHIKQLKVLRHLKNPTPTPVLGLYMHNKR